MADKPQGRWPSGISQGNGGAGDSLTKRERKILALWGDGKGDKQIADKLGVSLGTIQTHAKHIFLKLQVHTRGAALQKFWLNQQNKPTKRK